MKKIEELDFLTADIILKNEEIVKTIKRVSFISDFSIKKKYSLNLNYRSSSWLTLDCKKKIEMPKRVHLESFGLNVCPNVKIGSLIKRVCV